MLGKSSRVPVHSNDVINCKYFKGGKEERENKKGKRARDEEMGRRRVRKDKIQHGQAGKKQESPGTVQGSECGPPDLCIESTVYFSVH